MEDPLIAGEGSSPGGSRNRWKNFLGRFDAISRGNVYQRAAALVDLAEDGVGLPEEILEGDSFESSAKYYFIYLRFDLLWSLNLLALVVLNFIEKPLWCSKSGDHSCKDREYFFLGELPYLTISQSVVYEGVTLLVLLAHTFFPLIYEGHLLFWKNIIHQLKVGFLVLLVADLIVFSLSLSSLPIGILPFRLAPYLRIILFALNIRELRSSAVTVARMMSMFLNILFLWALFVLFSSWVAYVTFEDTQQGKTNFTSFGATLYSMFVLFTTSNNPDVWLPAYKSARWSVLFFVLYVLIGVYFVTNLILGSIFDAFKEQLARQLRDMDSMRKRILHKAFSVIDIHNDKYLNKSQCARLFEELNNYRSLPSTSDEDFDLIFSELDDSGDFKINAEEFADLCNAIASKFEKEAAPSWFEYCPGFYHSDTIKSLKAFVKSPTFGNIVSFVLVLNLIAVIIETTLDIQNSSAQKIWQVVEFAFGWFYILEVNLKIFSYGFDYYWMDGQNRFDFVITWIIFIGEALTFFFPGIPFLSNGEWIRYLLIARMLRLLRILLQFKQYRGFVATFITLVPTMMPYLGTIFCVMCLYCSFGVQLFGGLVNLGNPDLDSTSLYDNDYLLFNFNDYPNGMVTLFNLLVMGNWQVWMESYRDLTGTSWTLIYFISFYLITVLLLLNLIITFVLEAFSAEMVVESEIEPEEDEGTTSGRRRRVGVKSRSRNVDILLHRILSDELAEE